MSDNTIVVHVFVKPPLSESIREAMNMAALIVARAAYGEGLAVEEIAESWHQSWERDSVALKYKARAADA